MFVVFVHVQLLLVDQRQCVQKAVYLLFQVDPLTPDDFNHKADIPANVLQLLPTPLPDQLCCPLLAL